MGTGLEMEAWVFSWHLTVSKPSANIPAGGRQKSLLLPQAGSPMQMNSGAHGLVSASKILQGALPIPILFSHPDTQLWVKMALSHTSGQGGYEPSEPHVAGGHLIQKSQSSQWF